MNQLVDKKDLKVYTKFYFCDRNEGWKLGIRVMRWTNNPKMRVQFQKHRTNKKRKWVTSPKSPAYYVDLDDFLQLFNPTTGFAIQMLDEYNAKRVNK